MDFYNLTTPQKNIWNLQKYYEDTAIGNLCGAIFFKEKHDSNLLKEALYQIIDSQSGMCLRFHENEEPVQYICKEKEPIQVINFETVDEFNDYAEDFAKKPVGLADRAMYRFVVFQAGDRSGVLAVLSHLISDAWTFGIMANQLDKAYHNLADGTDNKICNADYTEYVQSEKKYFASERYKKDKAYWEGKYTAQPEKSIIRIVSAKTESIEAKRFTKSLSAELEDKIYKYCNDNTITPAVLFETALITYLSRVNVENNTITIGIPVLNRRNTEEKKIAGMFISTMPLTVEVKEDMAITELSEQISKAHIEIFRHEKYPYSDILKYLREKQNFSGNLYDVMISYQNAKTDTEAETKWYSSGYSEVPFVVHIDNRDDNNTHTINIDYQTAIFKDEREVKYIVSRLEYILAQIVSEVSTDIKGIDIIPQEEKKLVLEQFNDTYVEYPREKCIHELFTEQAKRTPDKTALIFEDKKFTYKQLDEMSNSLAYYLREKGVKRNDIVPIIARRSWHVIVAMLGIMKAGGAYMSVSPEFPIERIRYMLNEINAKISLVYNCNIEIKDIELIDLKNFNYNISNSRIININQIQDSCYVLFTSGSTGKPKAVIISHANLGNFVNNNENNMYQRDMVNNCKKVLADTAFTFDISIFEIYLALLNGLTVILSKDMADAFYLAELINKYNIDVFHCTPTKILMLLQTNEFQKAFKNIKMVMIGAEKFSDELRKKIEQFTDAVIYNGYGPTETTIGCSFKKLHYKAKCIHELFTEQAKRTPDKTALIAGEEHLTYCELDRKSDALAQKLIELGIKNQEVVGAYLDRTAYAVIAQLAVLKSGGVFLPIDHRYPKDRIDYMLNDCNVKLVLTDKELPYAWNVESFNIEKYQYNNILTENVKTEPEDICYIIYTSGSTGKPKGCVLKHKGVANFCLNNNIVPYAETLQHQTVVSVNTISFDFFIAETLMPLCHGWTVVLASEDESNSKELFKKLVVDNKVNIIETTPTRIELYTKDEKGKDSYFQQMELVLSGGEALTPVFLSKLRDISRAKIFNPLGPSECSIWNVGGDFKDDITIGSPIANNQIYILDKNNRLLPIGAPGELCIAGEGVGKGYLNRPELTAEKFVPNPFATKENHHGNTIYHTGDLACWRADGEIDYLGRIDTQVKIRGLRIELGEIENVMSEFNGIQLTAVTDRRDENNRQYLVAYYTSEYEIDEKELRSHLSSKLPKYMMPNYFMRLDTMPMTSTGKTDRKSLPVPDFTIKEREYVAPETEIEINLCKLLGEILHIEKVGVEDDFFEYGGDSLGAIEYVAKAHAMGIEMSLQNVFDYPTVRTLCSFLQEGKKDKVQYKKEDFDKYKDIFDRNIVEDDVIFAKKSLGNVLLTGATGFLGAHVLNELMQKEQGKIYCLVRSDKSDDRRGRLREILNYYFGDRYEAEINKRIIPVIGDIEKEGLSDELPMDVQTVIHTAASVKHYGSYSYFNRVNTEGTAHVVKYAKKTGAKLIHISTIGVSGNSLADDFSVYRSDEEKFFYETSLYIGQPLDNVYTHSKFEAECRVYDAMLEGLDAKVVRVGNLTNRVSDYEFQPNYTSNAFLTRLKAFLEFGLFPDYLMKLYAEFSPIDKTAEGIVKIAQYADKQCVFNLNSNKVLYFDRFIEVLKELGINMKVVSGKEFNSALQETIKQSNTEYIFEVFQNDMDEKGQLVYDTNIRIKNDFTVWFLNKTGFEWNKTDIEYISGYVDYFRKLGYLEV